MSAPTLLHDNRFRIGIGAAALAAAALAAGGFFLRGADSEAAHAGPDEPRPGRHAAEAEVTRVRVAQPKPGGFGRVSSQPGTVRALEWAELYAKVSGYIARLEVDLGDAVRRGQLLAEIDAPELGLAVDQARAERSRAEAEVERAAARIRAAEAEHTAAVAALDEARAEVARAEAHRSYRERQLRRLGELYSRQAIDAASVDRERDLHDEAVAAEEAAGAAERSARARLAVLAARRELARADHRAAEASLALAETELARAEVMADYRRITSPYNGIVTRRHVHRGDFVRSGAEGQASPLLRVARADRMRIVVDVPEPQVPYLDPGDPVTIRFDALRGETFEGSITRLAGAEDIRTRTMRAEIEVPNPDGRLREGMYGRVRIELEPPSDGLRIPSSSLAGLGERGRGFVYVVRDGHARRTPLMLGNDDGIDVEVLSGLGPRDAVVVQGGGEIADGEPVAIVSDEVAALDSAPGHG